MNPPTLSGPERITLFDGEEWRCVCGNHSDSDGFSPCTLSGKPVEPSKEAGWDGECYRCARCGRVIDQYTLEVKAYTKHGSTTQPGLWFWAEPNGGGAGAVESYCVVSQVDGYPATEAHDDWLANWKDADEIAQALARGENVQ